MKTMLESQRPIFRVYWTLQRLRTSFNGVKSGSIALNKVQDFLAPIK
jgi:hypothetical protein